MTSNLVADLRYHSQHVTQGGKVMDKAADWIDRASALLPLIPRHVGTDLAREVSALLSQQPPQPKQDETQPVASNEWGGVEKLAQQRNDALAEVERLTRENTALRNLAENLRPGPISEALGGVEHERSYRVPDETPALPAAWYRPVRSPSTPNGPAEYDVELAWGDWPPGEPDDTTWHPLYTRPALEPRETTGVRRLLELVARMLPYVQQSEPADFADIEAATAIGREATEALATIRPEEPTRRIPPREFDIESHAGLYTESAAPRGKPCTCDNCLGSSASCRVEAGERLGDLWYCRKAARAAVKTNVCTCGRQQTGDHEPGCTYRPDWL